MKFSLFGEKQTNKRINAGETEQISNKGNIREIERTNSGISWRVFFSKKYFFLPRKEKCSAGSRISGAMMAQ